VLMLKFKIYTLSIYIGLDSMNREATQ